MLGKSEGGERARTPKAPWVAVFRVRVAKQKAGQGGVRFFVSWPEGRGGMRDVPGIGLVCALEREALPVFEALGASPRTSGGLNWARAGFHDTPLMLAWGGMGTTNAAATTQFVLDRLEREGYARALIFFGIAGGLNPALGCGDFVIGTRLERLGTDAGIIAEAPPRLTSFSSDAQLARLATRELEAQGLVREKPVRELAASGMPDGTPLGTTQPHAPCYTPGTIATSDLFTTDGAVLREIRATWAADCEEMEGAAAAQVAARAGVPFLCVRCLSNICGEPYDSLDAAEERLNATTQAAASVALSVAGRLAGLEG